MISRKLIEVIRNEFILDWKGIHGVGHWARVRNIGLKLAKLTGANPTIVELFAFLHDSKRFHDGTDPDHGKRAVDFALSLQGSLIQISNDEFDQLAYACLYHSDGITDADITIQTCWDADRLDLGRVGIKPKAQYLCTVPAKDPSMIEWAYARSHGLKTHSTKSNKKRWFPFSLIKGSK